MCVSICYRQKKSLTSGLAELFRSDTDDENLADLGIYSDIKRLVDLLA